MMEKIDLSLEIAGKEFKNPIWLASGTCGYGEELADFFKLDQIGAIVTKTITKEPRPGHPPPRVFETGYGMLNAIGLQNVGVDEFIESKLPFLEKQNANLIVNIAGRSVEEYCSVCEKLNDASQIISAIELNMSCPNVTDGLEFSKNPKLAEELIKRTKSVATCPIIAKLSPNVADISEIAVASEQAGADAISLINTLVGMAVDIETFKPRLSNVTGGLSGPPIKPVAIAMVYKVYNSVSVPVIGIGGIMDYRDVIEFMLCGASAVQIGTANFINPRISIEIIESLKRWMESRDYRSLNDIVGKVRA
ncbi:MAG: dihydroorotate dehydrogenase [candidate division Zixibacteria bacterium]|nr:dihydroorotate dehydrogenase [candidate division Zixibacteria bacterium]